MAAKYIEDDIWRIVTHAQRSAREDKKIWDRASQTNSLNTISNWWIFPSYNVMFTMFQITVQLRNLSILNVDNNLKLYFQTPFNCTVLSNAAYQDGEGRQNNVKTVQ